MKSLFRPSKPIFKWTIFALILWVMPWLSSCIYVPPVWDSFDTVYRVDSIKSGVTTKEEVLQKFGEPDSKDPYYKPVRYTYVGYKSHGTVVGIHSPFDTAPIDSDLPINQKRWKVVIRFDENDIVSSVSISEKKESTYNKYRYGSRPSHWRQSNVDLEWLKAKEAGAYCPNADLGHADAQLHVANILYYGVIRQKDSVRAWVWYSLSTQNGDIRAAEQLSRVTVELSPEQLAEAKQQLESWKPGQCEHDLTPDQKK